jgi:DNA-binding MarR family transcriptional regulator
MHEEVHDRLALAGFPEVKPAHGAVLSYIEEGRGQITAMAQIATTSKQNMSYLVDYMEKHGYVESVPDEKDGRAKVFRLTPRGQQCKATAIRIINEIAAEWEAKLGKQKMKQLFTLLVELNEHIEGDMSFK